METRCAIRHALRHLKDEMKRFLRYVPCDRYLYTLRVVYTLAVLRSPNVALRFVCCR